LSQRVEINVMRENDETFVSINLEGQSFRIKDVTENWITNKHDFFKVNVTSGRRFLLRRNRLTDIWAIEDTA